MTTRGQLYVVIACLIWGAGCSCAVSHELDGGISPDGTVGDGASPIDVATDGQGFSSDGDETGTAGDAGVCRPGMVTCATDDDCVAWNAAVGPPGTFVVSRCSTGGCTLGLTGCFVHDGRTVGCTCESMACNFDEICVTDTPGGTPRCALECVGR